MSQASRGEIHDLLATSELAGLGPGPRPGVKMARELTAAMDEVDQRVRVSEANQRLIRALVLLWHDHLDAAHVIAQEVENPDGAFVHGIVHRREPDFSNAAYWFRRVGKHPAFGELVIRVKALPDSNPAFESAEEPLVANGTWDPFAFIHRCENAGSRASPAEKHWLQQVQALETAVLVDYLSRAKLP